MGIPCARPARPRRPPPRRRGVRRDPARRHGLRRLRRQTLRGGRRPPRGPHREGRQPGRRPRQGGAGRQGARRGSGLHQHAELGHGLAHRRRPGPERHPPGCDPGGHGRGVVHGAAQRRHEERGGRAAGGYQVRHHLDHPGRVPGRPGRPGHLRERGLLRGRHDGARPRGGLREPSAQSRGARADAQARGPGHGGGRARRGLVAHLRPGLLRRHGRARGPVRRGRQVRRHVHLPHAQRGQPPRRRGGRADHHRPARRSPGRDGRTGASSMRS
jgi:hypothetical protein